MSSVIIIPHDEQDGTGDEALAALAFDCGTTGEKTLSCLLFTDTFFPSALLTFWFLPVPLIFAVIQ